MACKKCIQFIVGMIIVISSVHSVFAQRPAMSKIDSTKKIKIAAIPVINYDRSYGLIIGALGSMFYKINKTDTISPSSSSMLMGIWATNHTAMIMGVQQFYFNEDRWRLKLIGGSGNIFFQYFQEVPNLPPSFPQVFKDGTWIDYNTNAQFLVIDARRKVFSNFYAGILFTSQWTKTTFDIENPVTGEKPTDSANMISLGYSLLYDSRDNVNYPDQGYFIQFKNNFNREAFGSTSDFNGYELAANYFWDINHNSNSILVSRIYTEISAGDVPFQGENYIGGDDLRGYSQGRYRGNQVYALQTELRQHVYKRFSAIAFFGFGTAVNSFSDLSDAPFLPSLGGGVRYRMIPSEKINIGIDAGVGKDDWSLTFRIGETFGR